MRNRVRRSPVSRIFALLSLLLALWVAPARGESRNVNEVFASARFQQWLAEGPKADFPWHPRISSPELTLYQRIASRVEVQLDGNELVNRCCDGEAVALVEIKDEQGRSYRNYAIKELRDVKPGLSQYMVSLSWQVFLLPGDYSVTIGFYYSGHDGHSLTTERVHVVALKHDPLPDSWRELPSVEFCDPQPDGLDEFLLPNTTGRLRLPVATKRPVHIQILANLTAYPSEGRRTSLYRYRLGKLLPILRTFGQLSLENGSVGLSLLDFSHRGVIFDQPEIEGGQLASTELKQAIAANSAEVVSVRDLQNADHYGEFFRSEMVRRFEVIRTDDGPRQVFIIVSGSMELGSGKPIEITKEARGNLALYYLRCDFVPATAVPRINSTLGMSGPRVGITREQYLEHMEDGIGKALRGLKPKVFGVESPKQAREAIAAILSDTARN